ncbi:penicillin-binding protein [Caulobacter segnis]|uniref:Beta-lactamase n=2 Tax=Caulobacter segnis TaxID=88688 RepID=D5VHY1_CAUST|nr:serine hydrolase [Caulobacter segnis]ADG09234.1 beta-lactamase [Caulobacter segnis ATCC 21756]AVQ01047.1 penicillin-binding protein [Caulobacter segnis]
MTDLAHPSRRHVVGALAALLSSGAPVAGSAASPAKPPAEAGDIDAFVRAALARIETVPGLSLAVVKGDAAVLVAGYGVADVRTGTRVDADTGFYIASATKAFTALALARMAGRGELGLDTPVAAWAGASPLPADIGGSITLTDLLSHRSGLENAPIPYRAAYTGQHDPALMRALLAPTVRSPTTPYGTFRYTNTGYNLATTLTEGRFGRDWRALVQREVLAPAGMRRTTGWISKARRQGVVATSHVPADDGRPTPSPLQKVDATMQSAGGLVSTARDMARWLELQLNDGRLDGRRVFPAGLVASTHRAVATQQTVFGPYARDGYGLGWQTGRYGDEVLIHHFGNFAGARAHVSFMPARGLGVAVMANEDLMAGELVDLVANYAYDRFAGRPDLAAHYDAELAALAARRDKRQAGLAKSRAERAARPWSLARPTGDYVGTYENPDMGRIEICEVDGRMTARAGVMSATAEAGSAPESVRIELVPLQGQILRFDGVERLVLDGQTYGRVLR